MLVTLGMVIHERRNSVDILDEKKFSWDFQKGGEGLQIKIWTNILNRQLGFVKKIVFQLIFL